MATENQDNDKMETAPSLTKRGASRRRLAKAGIGAGIIATLESKSAMAADLVCRSPSGSLSHGLAASHYKNGTAPACNGMGLDYWKSAAWPVDRDKMFSSVFYVKMKHGHCPARASTHAPGEYHKPKSFACATLADLLNDQDFDPAGVGREFVLAYLNFSSGKIGFIDLTQLQTMWSELATSGHYSPTAGVNWGNVEVASYLNSTHAP